MDNITVCVILYKLRKESDWRKGISVGRFSNNEKIIDTETLEVVKEVYDTYDLYHNGCFITEKAYIHG